MVFLPGLVLVFKIKVIISVHISSKILDFCRLKGLITNKSVLFVRVTRGPWGQVSPLGGLRGLIWRPTRVKQQEQKVISKAVSPRGRGTDSGQGVPLALSGYF